MIQPQVSIVIPVYNRAELIAETLRSVLSQTYDSYEVLVVDDGSTDDSTAIVSHFGEPVRLIREEHRGMGGSYSRNRGIRESAGQFIAFLDSDDLWLPEKLERQMALLNDRPELSWVYCESEAVDGSNQKLIYRHSTVHDSPSGVVLTQLFNRNFLHTSTLIIKREVFERVGKFWPSPKATDWDMWLRIASEYPIDFLQEMLVRYRIHENRVTDNLSGEKSYEAGLAVVNRALDRDPERLKSHRNQALTQLNISTGMLLASHTKLREARMYFRRAISLRPTLLASYPYLFSTYLGKDLFNGINMIRRYVRKLRSRKNRQ